MYIFNSSLFDCRLYDHHHVTLLPMRIHQRTDSHLCWKVSIHPFLSTCQGGTPPHIQRHARHNRIHAIPQIMKHILVGMKGLGMPCWLGRQQHSQCGTALDLLCSIPGQGMELGGGVTHSVGGRRRYHKTALRGWIMANGGQISGGARVETAVCIGGETCGDGGCGVLASQGGGGRGEGGGGGGCGSGGVQEVVVEVQAEGVVVVVFGCGARSGMRVAGKAGVVVVVRHVVEGVHGSRAALHTSDDGLDGRGKFENARP